MFVIKALPKLVVLIFAFFIVKRLIVILKPEVNVAIVYPLLSNTTTTSTDDIRGVLYGISKLNKQGGLLGATINPVFFSTGADYIIINEGLETNKFKAFFGCSYPVCRRKLKKQLNKHKQLLVYSGTNEGLSNYKSFLCTSLMPNQMLFPAIDWLTSKFGNRVYIIYQNDYFSQTLLRMIEAYAKLDNLQIVGRMEIEHQTTASDFKPKLIKDLYLKKSDIVLNFVTGDNNLLFHNSLQSYQQIREFVKIVSIGASEKEVNFLGKENMSDIFFITNYLSTLKNKENLDLIKGSNGYLSKEILNTPFVNGYNAVMVWAKAAEKAKSWERDKILKALDGLTINTPAGELSYQNGINCPASKIFISKIQKNGLGKILWKSADKINPIPYPFFSKVKWEKYLDYLSKILISPYNL